MWRLGLLLRGEMNSGQMWKCVFPTWYRSMGSSCCSWLSLSVWYSFSNFFSFLVGTWKQKVTVNDWIQNNRVTSFTNVTGSCSKRSHTHPGTFKSPSFALWSCTELNAHWKSAGHYWVHTLWERSSVSSKYFRAASFAKVIRRGHVTSASKMTEFLVSLSVFWSWLMILMLLNGEVVIGNQNKFSIDPPGKIKKKKPDGLESWKMTQYCCICCHIVHLSIFKTCFSQSSGSWQSAAAQPSCRTGGWVGGWHPGGVASSMQGHNHSHSNTPTDSLIYLTCNFWRKLENPHRRRANSTQEGPRLGIKPTASFCCVWGGSTNLIILHYNDLIYT